MRISWQTLNQIVPQAKQALSGMSIGSALKIIHTHYCGPMTVYGRCPQSCARCAPQLSRLSDLGNARSKPGLLTWLMREAFASRPVEKSEPAASVNPLDDLRRMLGEEQA